MQMFSKKHQDEKDEVLQAMKSMRYFLPFQHPAFRFSLTIEGYQKWHFGCRAGPEYHIKNLFHELGHAVDFGPENFKTRVRCGYLRFSCRNRITVCGEKYDEPRTIEATLREVRAIAYQMILLRLAGYRVDEEEMVSDFVAALAHVMDHLNVLHRFGEAWKTTLEKKVWKLVEETDSDWVMDRLLGWLDRTQKSRSFKEMEKSMLEAS